LKKQDTQYVWAKYEDQFDYLYKLYTEDLLSFEDIGEKCNIEWWNIKQLFKAKSVPFISHKERSRILRAKDFPFLYDLKYNKKLTMNQIYRDYKMSPPYVRQVLKENLKVK
jgi:hypothetical protein